MYFRRFAVAFALCLGLGGNADASIIIDFDDLADGTVLDSQYSSLGVTITGGRVISQALSPWPATSGTNLAYAPTGTISLFFDPTILGDIFDVTVYVSTESYASVMQYGVNGNALGGTSLTIPQVNTFVGEISNAFAIGRVDIIGPASGFTIDTLTIGKPSAAAVPEPSSIALLGVGLAGLAASRRKAKIGGGQA